MGSGQLSMYCIVLYVSILFMLYNMDEVCYNHIGTYAFEAKRAEAKIHCCLFTLSSKPEMVILRCCFDEYGRKMYRNACRRCSAIIFSSSNQY